MDIAKYIDYTLLKATATPADIEKLCKEALEYGFYSVCVNSGYVPLAAEQLKGHGSAPAATGQRVTTTHPWHQRQAAAARLSILSPKGPQSPPKDTSLPT